MDQENLVQTLTMTKKALQSFQESRNLSDPRGTDARGHATQDFPSKMMRCLEQSSDGIKRVVKRQSKKTYQPSPYLQPMAQPSLMGRSFNKKRSPGGSQERETLNISRNAPRKGIG